MSQVIVVGAGNWGKNLVKTFNQLGALAGVVELDPGLRNQVISQYPEMPIYENLADVLDLPNVAIAVATPAPTHFALVKEALLAGKDVFVEKPMTLKRSEAQALAELADEKEQILMVGHLLLYQPAIAWMQEYIASGAMGKVYRVETARNKLGRVRSNENVWWSFAPHDVSVVLALLNQPTLTGVSGAGEACLQPGIWDHIHADLQFGDGYSAHIQCSWLWPQVERRTVVIGEKQMLVFDELQQTVTVHEKWVDGTLTHQDQGSWLADLPQQSPLLLECQHFLDCIKSRQRPLSDGWNGVAVVEILEKLEVAING